MGLLTYETPLSVIAQLPQLLDRAGFQVFVADWYELSNQRQENGADRYPATIVIQWRTESLVVGIYDKSQVAETRSVIVHVSPLCWLQSVVGRALAASGARPDFRQGWFSDLLYVGQRDAVLGWFEESCDRMDLDLPTGLRCGRWKSANINVEIGPAIGNSPEDHLLYIGLLRQGLTRLCCGTKLLTKLGASFQHLAIKQIR